MTAAALLAEVIASTAALKKIVRRVRARVAAAEKTLARVGRA